MLRPRVTPRRWAERRPRISRFIAGLKSGSGDEVSAASLTGVRSPVAFVICVAWACTHLTALVRAHMYADLDIIK